MSLPWFIGARLRGGGGGGQVSELQYAWEWACYPTSWCTQLSYTYIRFTWSWWLISEIYFSMKTYYFELWIDWKWLNWALKFSVMNSLITVSLFYFLKKTLPLQCYSFIIISCHTMIFLNEYIVPFTIFVLSLFFVWRSGQTGVNGPIWVSFSNDSFVLVKYYEIQ